MVKGKPPGRGSLGLKLWTAGTGTPLPVPAGGQHSLPAALGGAAAFLRPDTATPQARESERRFPQPSNQTLTFSRSTL